MGMLWAIPPLVLILGVLVAATLASRAGDLGAGLRDELLRLGEIQTAVAEVRAESATARHRADQLRPR
jgi:hypothetical protein